MLGNMPYDPDVYGEILGSHWSERLIGPSPYRDLACQDGCAQEPPKEEEKESKLRVYDISIEEIDEDLDLAKGLKTKALKEVSFTPALYRVAPKSVPYFDKHLEGAEQDQDGNYVLTVDTYVLHDDVIGDEGLWTVFNLHGLILINIGTNYNANGSKKYIKASQKFKVAVVNHDCVPYMQLVCNARRAKYAESWFKEGDVVTLFVKHHKMPTLPSPPLISIQPKAEQTFIPMLPKQKLQIITDLSQSEVEWRLDGDSALLYRNRLTIGMDFSRRIGTNVVCDYFEYVRDAESQELVFINSRSENRSKTVCVPVLGSCRGRYPIIFDPVKTCVIYSHNIDGFILRSKSYTPLTIDKECSLMPVYSSEGLDYCETKVKVTKTKPCFILERQGNKWFAREN